MGAKGLCHHAQTTFEDFNSLKHFVFGVGLFSFVLGIKPRTPDIEKGVGRFQESNFILDIVISFKTCPDAKMEYTKTNGDGSSRAVRIHLDEGQERSHTAVP